VKGENMTLPLEGIRILDSAHQYPGPYCTMLLADMGAEVVKVERPGGGDPARQLPDFFRTINRNKRSLTLDMKSPAGREILLRLVERYDVFTEGFRPAVTARLGIDFESLSKVNPRLVYCSISGYGQDGPFRDVPGHDLNYQAMAGMLEGFLDRNGEYIVPRITVADLSSGMFAVIGILGALMAREKSGKGQYVDVSMFDGLLSWMSAAVGMTFAVGMFDFGQDAGYGIFRGADGKSFTLGIAHEDWFWQRLCSVVGLENHTGLNALERRLQRPDIEKDLQNVFSGKDRDEWVRMLIEADVPVAPVNDMETLPNDPHVRAREMIQDIALASGQTIRQVSFPIEFSTCDAKKIRRPPPELGEHTDQVLLEIGYSEKDVSRFREEGVV
jgi:crotonobetainyl-CoA:carnitine CoA-transferase CaiB-like acyl-CoA transferase